MIAFKFLPRLANSAVSKAGIGTSSSRALGTAEPLEISSDELPPMPPCDYLPPAYEGPSKAEVLRLRKLHVNVAMQRQTFYKDPPMFTSGKGQFLFDESGRRYLDMFGGICTVGAGHSHDKINAAVRDQMSLLTHTSNLFVHSKLSEYSQELVKKFPEESGLSVVYLCNSGSEANDMAMMMARAYTGYLNIVGLRRAYHGAGVGTLPLTTIPAYRHATLPITNISHTMSPDVYRGSWGGSHCRDSPCQTLRSCDCAPDGCMAADMYAGEYKDHLHNLCPIGKGLAGFIGEGIGGVSAGIQPPKGYYKQMFEITKSYGGVNIMDEVQSGFGRLGTHFWGFEYHGVTPDIVTAAKSIGNGHPMALCITRPEIAEAFANSSAHINTFGGNAVSCAAGLATLKAIDEDGLMQNSHVVGTHILEGLNKLRAKHDILGDCRGKGLFIAMEFVDSQSTNNPVPNFHLNAIVERIKDLGVIIGKGGVFANCCRIQPAMCVTMEDADFTLAVLDKVFTEYSQGKLDLESFNPNQAK